MNNEEKRMWAVEQSIKAQEQIMPTFKDIIEMSEKFLEYVNEKPLSEKEANRLKKKFEEGYKL